MICWEHIGRAVRNDSASALVLDAKAAEAQRFQRTNQKADSNFGWLDPIIQHPVSRGKGHQPATLMVRKSMAVTDVRFTQLPSR